MWYAIGIGIGNTSYDQTLQYTTVYRANLNLQHTPVQTAGIIGNTNGCAGPTGLAIGKYNTTDKSRILYTISRSAILSGTSFIQRFKITDNGITQLSQLPNMLSLFGPGYTTTSASEVELYENPTTGDIRVCWADCAPICGSTGIYRIYYLDFDNHGYGANTGGGSFALPMSFITGLELYDGGKRALISNQDQTGVGNLYSVDLINHTTTLIPNSGDYSRSQIEKARNGMYYACGLHGSTPNQTFDLRAIDITDPANPTMMDPAVQGAVIPLSRYQKYLPNQVDDEVYNIDANTNNSDVIAQDDASDIGSEPNLRSATYNASPDLWNIRSASAANVNQHANPVCFYSAETQQADQHNIVRFRVRNSGCSMSDARYARLYWSVQGNSVNWPNAWNGSNQINGLPAGGEIIENYSGTVTLNTGTNNTPNGTYVSNKGFPIPALQPGEEYIINAQWNPVDPALYGSASGIAANAQISFLGRITDDQGNPPAAEMPGVLASVNAKSSMAVVMRDANLTAPGRLMAKDNSDDIGQEPYNPPSTNSDIWKSNDIWNRVTDNGAGNTAPENPNYLMSPVYPSTTPVGNAYNVMRFRVRNNSTEVSAPSHAKLYWTIGSTAGEIWPYAWKAGLGQMAPYFITINGTSSSQPVGDELKVAYTGTLLNTGTGANSAATAAYEYSLSSEELGFPIPSLKPGEEYIINAKWQPLNPTPFDTYFRDANGDLISNPSICFLGRIIDPLHDPMYLEQSPAPVGLNVKSNNNVVTRNSTLINMSTTPPVFLRTHGGSVSVGNHLTVAAALKIKIRQHALSNTAPEFGTVATATITLDEDLWNAWLSGGSVASGLAIDRADLHTLTIIDPDNATLSNIALQPGEFHNVGISFVAQSENQNTGDY